MVFVLVYVSPEKTLCISAISLLPLTLPIPSYMFSSLSYLSLSFPSPHCLLLSLLKYICSSSLGLPQPLNYVFSYRYLVLVCRLQESQNIFVRGKIRQEGATTSYIPRCWCSPLYEASTSRHKTPDTIRWETSEPYGHLYMNHPQLKDGKETSDHVLGQLAVREYSIRWRRTTHSSKQFLETSLKLFII